MTIWHNAIAKIDKFNIKKKFKKIDWISLYFDIGCKSRINWHQRIHFYFYFKFSDKAPSEATFRGTEFLSYDLGQTGGEPIVSAQDAISLYFRTRQPNGLLFYTGV